MFFFGVWMDEINTSYRLPDLLNTPTLVSDDDFWLSRVTLEGCGDRELAGSAF